MVSTRGKSVNITAFRDTLFILFNENTFSIFIAAIFTSAPIKFRLDFVFVTTTPNCYYL